MGILALSNLSPTREKQLIHKYRRYMQRADDEAIDKLANPEYEDFLYTKYKKYQDPGMFAIKQAIVDAWLVLHNAFNSNEFSKTGTNKISPYSGEKALPAARKLINDNMANENYYFKRYDKSVEIKVSLPPIPLYIGYGMGLTNDQRFFQDQAREQVEIIIQSILPEFELPKNWITDTDKQTGIKRLQPDFKDIVSKRMLLEHFAKITMPYTAKENLEGIPHDFILPIDYTNNFDHAVTLEFEIAGSGSEILNPNTYSLTHTNGTLDRIGSTIKFELIVRAFITFPLEYALWSTCSIKKEHFIEKLFYDFIHGLWIKTVYNNPTKNEHTRISNLSVVRNHNNNKIQTLKFNPRPRTNKEGYCILSNGTIMYCPTIDNVGQFMLSFKNSFSNDNTTIRPNSDELKKLRLSIRNTGIYTDWINNRFLYVNEENKLISTSLEGAIPLDDVTIHRLFETSIFQQKEFDLFRATSFFNVLQTNIESLHIDISDITSKSFSKIEGMLSYLRNSGVDVTFYELAGKSLNPGFKRQQEVVNNLHEIIRRASGRFNEFNISITQKSEYVKLGFDLVLLYGKDYNKYEHNFHEANKINNVNTSSIEDINKFGSAGVFDFPNIAGIKSILPHQGKVITALGKLPKSAIIAVDPGGAKSLFSILDALMNKTAGKVNRTVTCVPTNLVSEMVNEVNKFGNGKLNAFPLTLETIRDKLIGTLGMSLEQVIKYIRAMPPNTIFVCSYDFLKSTSDLETRRKLRPLIYANEKIQPYPVVEFMRRIGFDMIIMDESHNIKTQTSSRTIALSNVACEIPFRRVMSGTIISNTPIDVVGQAAIINPAIFGNANNFSQMYGKTLEKTGSNSVNKNIKVLSWQTSLGQGIRQQVRPYAQYHNVTKREWAFMLPKIQEDFFQVPYDLTQKQKEYYDDLMAEDYSKIQADVELSKKLKRGAPEDEDYIESQLKRYLSKVEIFVNAPSEDEHYRQIVDDPDDDHNLRSSKGRLIDELIDLHFDGGVYPSDTSITFTPDKNKVIVFSYNRAVSIHLFKYTKHREIALHYTAGDNEILTKFRDDNHPSKILFADEGGIREGINLQCASYLIRVQQIWSPGPQDQALARIFRPDIGNRYNREKIRYSWLVQPNTIEIPKCARLVCKLIDKAKSNYGHELPAKITDKHLEIIKMNLDLIKKYRNFDDIEKERGSDYLSTYKDLVVWEQQNFTRITNQIKAIKEKELGRTISLDELKTLAMIPIHNTRDLPGSKQVYVPRVRGAEIYSEYGIKVKPASIIEDNSIDDDSTTDEVVNKSISIDVGDVVDTEFGPMTVIRVTGSTIRGKPKGFIKPIILPRSVVGVPQDQEQRKKIRKLLRNGTTTTLLPKGFPVKDMLRMGEQEEEPEVEDIQEETPDLPQSVKIELAIINDIPTLWTMMTKEDIPVLTREYNWKAIPPFIAAQIRRPQGVSNFLEEIDKAKLNISEGNKELLLDVAHHIKTGQIFKAHKANISARWRDFFTNSHRRVTSRRLVRAYPFVWDSKVYIALNLRVHNQNVISKVKIFPAQNGMRKFITYNYQLLLYPIISKLDALKELKQINKSLNIENYDDIIIKLKK